MTLAALDRALGELADKIGSRHAPGMKPSSRAYTTSVVVSPSTVTDDR
jgi:hypothetical protein